MDVVSIRDFSREQIEHVLELSEKMVPIAKGEEIDRAWAPAGSSEP
jgi:aspartate carbamoyltransferase catalytic subunit